MSRYPTPFFWILLTRFCFLLSLLASEYKLQCLLLFDWLCSSVVLFALLSATWQLFTFHSDASRRSTTFKNALQISHSPPLKAFPASSDMNDMIYPHHSNLPFKPVSTRHHRLFDAGWWHIHFSRPWHQCLSFIAAWYHLQILATRSVLTGGVAGNDVIHDVSVCVSALHLSFIEGCSGNEKFCHILTIYFFFGMNFPARGSLTGWNDHSQRRWATFKSCRRCQLDGHVTCLVNVPIEEVAAKTQHLFSNIHGQVYGMHIDTASWNAIIQRYHSCNTAYIQRYAKYWYSHIIQIYH